MSFFLALLRLHEATDKELDRPGDFFFFFFFGNKSKAGRLAPSLSVALVCFLDSEEKTRSEKLECPLSCLDLPRISDDFLELVFLELRFDGKTDEATDDEQETIENTLDRLDAFLDREFSGDRVKAERLAPSLSAMLVCGDVSGEKMRPEQLD